MPWKSGAGVGGAVDSACAVMAAATLSGTWDRSLKVRIVHGQSIVAHGWRCESWMPGWARIPLRSRRESTRRARRNRFHLSRQIKPRGTGAVRSTSGITLAELYRARDETRSQGRRVGQIRAPKEVALVRSAPEMSALVRSVPVRVGADPDWHWPGGNRSSAPVGVGAGKVGSGQGWHCEGLPGSDQVAADHPQFVGIRRG